MLCGSQYLNKKKWPEGGWPGGITLIKGYNVAMQFHRTNREVDP